MAQAPLHPRSRPRCYLVFDDAGLGVTSGDTLGSSGKRTRDLSIQRHPRYPSATETARPPSVVLKKCIRNTLLISSHFLLQNFVAKDCLCHQGTLLYAFCSNLTMGYYVYFYIRKYFLNYLHFL